MAETINKSEVGAIVESGGLGSLPYFIMNECCATDCSTTTLNVRGCGGCGFRVCQNHREDTSESVSLPKTEYMLTTDAWGRSRVRPVTAGVQTFQFEDSKCLDCLWADQTHPSNPQSMANFMEKSMLMLAAFLLSLMIALHSCPLLQFFPCIWYALTAWAIGYAALASWVFGFCWYLNPKRQHVRQLFD